MLRLTLMLSAAIFAGLVIFSEPAPVVSGAPAAPAQPAEVARGTAGIDVTLPAPRQTLLTADGRALPIAAVIDPVAMSDGARGIALISTAGGDITLTSAPVAPVRPLVEVTGNRVNLRAGPSTDTAVLGAMVRGERAEVIASPGDGWVQIRAVASGTVGYMADRFVSPAD